MRREQTLADRITSSSVWRSVVRHGYPDNQRNQALIIASNVFLHIHPVKIKRYATKVTYTFCLGGLSFFMFLVLVADRRAADVLLRPVLRPGLSEHEGHRSQRDLRAADAKHASLVRPGHGDRRLPPYGPRLLHRFVQAAARVQLGDRRAVARGDLPALVHRLSAAVGPAGLWAITVGTQDRWRGPDPRPEGRLPAQG